MNNQNNKKKQYFICCLPELKIPKAKEKNSIRQNKKQFNHFNQK